MRRKGEQYIVCRSCDAEITIRSFCPNCGTPTSFATEEERVKYEVTRWRSTHNGSSEAARIAQQRSPTQPPKKKPRIQLLPGTNGSIAPETNGDALRVAAGTGEERIEVVYQPAPASPPREARPKRPRKQRPQVREVIAKPAREVRAKPRTSQPAHQRPAPESFDLIGDETIRFSEEGRSGMRKARLVITWYRVALVTGNKVRWMPLEEVQRVRMSDTATVEVDSGTEQLRFAPSNGTTPEALHSMIAQEVAGARVSNSPRHHPDILQEWCEQSSERYKSGFRLLSLGR